MADITIGRTLNASTDSVSVGGLLAGLTYDAVYPSYDADDRLIGVVYKLAGTTVATLTLGYTGDNLTSAVRT